MRRSKPTDFFCHLICNHKPRRAFKSFCGSPARSSTRLAFEVLEDRTLLSSGPITYHGQDV
jgi:hypothetical protein